MVMTDETVVDVLEIAEKVLVEVSERVKVRKMVPQFFLTTTTELLFHQRRGQPRGEHSLPNTQMFFGLSMLATPL